ncbi:MAG: hypothetical protein V5A44_07310 [Haloarculaceae archaeon]
MSGTPDSGDVLSTSLAGHVLEPLSTAEGVVETEHAEVEAERRAFVRFSERVAGVETMTSPAGTAPAGRAVGDTRRSDATRRLRGAFRETVMSVDHYERVYGESLVEHAAAELSPEAAAGLSRDGTVPVTELYKRTLNAAIETAIDGRESFCDQLEDELTSLAESRDALVTLLDRCDGPTVPGRHRGDVASGLEDLAERRQATVQRRAPASRVDGHDLCDYIYADESWTYPVLTAVTRFRTATV